MPPRSKTEQSDELFVCVLDFATQDEDGRPVICTPSESDCLTIWMTMSLLILQQANIGNVPMIRRFI